MSCIRKFLDKNKTKHSFSFLGIITEYAYFNIDCDAKESKSTANQTARTLSKKTTKYEKKKNINLLWQKQVFQEKE